MAETAAVAAAEASWPQTRAILRIIIIILLVAAMMWVLYRLEGVLLLVVLSIFFAYLIAPLVEFVRRPFHVRGRQTIMPRIAALAIVYVVIFGSLIRALAPAAGLSNRSKHFRKRATVSDHAAGRVKLLNDFCRRNGFQNVCNALNDTATGAIERPRIHRDDLPTRRDCA